jgi:ankyrin repeat protein
MSALIKACKKKDEDKAFEIFESGIDVNYINKFGETPLMMACSNRMHTVLILNILEKSTITTINSKRKNGDTALICACYNKKKTEAKWMLDIPEINVNQQNKKGETALMIACMYGLDTIVEKLLERKDTDLNLMDNYGSTALNYACREKGTKKIAEMLIERKDINVNFAALTSASGVGMEKQH